VTTLTPRERVKAALAYEETDIVPTNMFIEPEVEDKLTEHYGGNEWEQRINNHMIMVTYPLWLQAEPVEDHYIKDEYGAVWDFSRKPFHLVDFPFKEPSIEGYDFDTVTQTVLDGLDIGSAEIIIRDNPDKFVLGNLSFGLFERSWVLRGFENVLMDGILNESFYEELLDNILEMQLRLIDKLLELPLDGVYLGDDWGDQRGVIIGPERWRRFIKPRTAKLYERIKSSGKLVLTHCCGNVFDIIPDMIDIGLDVLESLQPEAMDVYEIKRKFGKDLRLWGGLGTQQVLPFGSPQDVRDEIRRLIEELGKGGGYILAPAKPLMEDIPTENAVAVLEEFAQES
jgi:uroporphyrinogen decarboxylase